MAKVWVIGCGNNQLGEWKRMWPEWRKNSQITLGCWARDDFDIAWDRNAIVKYIEKRHEEERRDGHEPGDTPNGQAGIILSFKGINNGDLVLIRSGSSGVLGVGVVEDKGISVSQTPLEPGTHYLYRSVRWLTTQSIPIQINSIKFAIRTVTDWQLRVISPDNENLNLADPNIILEGDNQRASDFRRVLGNLHSGEHPAKTNQPEKHSNTCKSISRNMNNILYGPPGTGKTHALTSLALSILAANQGDDASYVTQAQSIINGKDLIEPSHEDYQSWHSKLQAFIHAGRVEFTTFHQNYAYEDFVEGLKAELDEKTGTVHYKIEPGILKRIAYRALYSWLTGGGTRFALSEDKMGTVKDYLSSGKEPHGDAPESIPNYVLIIDEINRGNVARIFGELITLVEDSKRACREITLGSQPVFATLPYTKERFILPPNLHIIGTMNTADRSLIGLDAALRRRFDFIELPPRPELLSTDVGGINLSNFLSTLNQRIEDKDTRDHCIGHAYFMAANSFDDIQAVMRSKVIPQLQEYFHDRPAELKKLLSVGDRSFVNDKGVIDSDGVRDRAMYTGFAAQ